MIGVLTVVVLSLHLMCMNLASAGPICCLGFEIGESRGGVLAGKIGRWIANLSIFAFIVGSVLGLLLGWLVWTEQFSGALSLVESRVFYGVLELVFSLLLMIPYALWWRFAKPTTPFWLRLLRMSLPLLAGTNLLYHFPMLFSVVARLSTTKDAPLEPLSSAAFRTMAFSPEFVARSLHFTLAAFAVCGAALIVYALISRKLTEDQQKQTARWGGWLVLAPTFLQLPVGFWLLFESPRIWQANLMGGDAIATGVFVVSIGGAFWLMHLASNVAMGDSTRRAKTLAVAMIFLIIVLMTGVLHRTRTMSSTSNLQPAEQRNAA